MPRNAERPATQTARAVVAALVAHGVRDVVLCPGSRSAPMAFALHSADAEGLLRLHVRVDERSAGFLALGLTTPSGRRVAVVTTSGTAVGNLMPAVMEAYHSGRPLLVVSADRPEHLRGSGANQTTWQAGLFGRFAPCHDVPAGIAVEALAATVHDALSGTGPSQLNLQFDGPLTPPPSRSRHDPVEITTTGHRDHHDRPGDEPVTLTSGPRTVVVAGDDAGPPARLLAERAGWPLLAEPTSGARTGTNAIRTYRLLLRTALADGIERVVVVGHPTLSRPVTELISRRDLEVISVAGRASGIVTDPGGVARHVRGVPVAAEADDPSWLASWTLADAAVSRALDAEFSCGSGSLTALCVAAEISAAVSAGATLVVGSSNPVRDLDVMAAPWPAQEHRFVVGMRGLAGIDGVVSYAIGVALGRPHASRSLAVMGDLTFLHDANGLTIGPDEPRPDLTIVVVNDDGGSIFATLEQGAPDYADAFERVFGTPHGTDIGALCRAHGIEHHRVTDVEGLRNHLTAKVSGIVVVEVAVSRADRRAEAARLVELARSALASSR